MSNIANVNNQQPVMQNQQVQNVNNAETPAVLQRARPGVGSTVCRVLAGIFSFGITEGIFAICRHMEKNAAQAARGAAEALPAAAPTIAERNAAVSEQFKNDTLSPELKAAVSEAFSELRANYGENVLPECSTVGEFLEKTPFGAAGGGLTERSVIREVAKEIKNSETEISPQDLKNFILEKASPELNKLAARAVVLEQSPNITSHLGLNFADAPRFALSKTEGFTEQFAACKSTEEVKNCLLNHPKFAETVEYNTGLCKCEEKAIQTVLDDLALLTGKSQQEILKQIDMVELKNKFNYAIKDTEGKTVKERLEQLNTTIPNVAVKFIQMKTDLYTSIASLTVSEGLKEQLRNDILTESTLKKGYVFSRAEQAVTQVNVSPLIRVLQEGNAVSDLDLTGMLKAVSVQLSDAISKQYTNAELADLGGDGNAITMATACQILLDKNPELVELMKSDSAKIDRLVNLLAEQKYENDEQLGREDNMGSEATRLNAGAIYGSNFILRTVQDLMQANSSVISSLQANPEKAPFAQVLHDTLAEIHADYGVNAGANINDVANLPFGKDVINNIANRIADQNRLLSSAQFAEIVRSELQTHIANLAVKTVINERCKELGLNTDRLGSMLASLKQLYPALQESINRADSKEMIQALLLSCDKYENILRRESDIAAYSAEVMEDAHARLAALLNVDAKDVANTMALGKLNEGFLITAIDIHNEGDAANDGSVADIRERFQRVADRFVQGKSDLHAMVNDLDISQELKTAWRNEVNSNIGLKNPVLLRGCYDVAQRMDGSALRRGLQDRLNQTELLGLVKSLSAQIEVYAHQAFSDEQFNNMGSDETGFISYFARNVFWDKNGDLKALLKDNMEIMNGIFAVLDDEIANLTSQMTKMMNFDSPECKEVKENLAFAVNAQALIGDVIREE